MGKLIAVALWVLAFGLATHPVWAADDPECIAQDANDPARVLCWLTVTPTVRPTEAPSFTPEPPSATPLPTATSTPVAPPATPVAVLPIPANGLIDKPGVYSGSRDCAALTNIWGYCMWIDAPDVTLQDFSILSGGHGIGTARHDNITLRRGVIVARNAGLMIWSEASNILVDHVSMTVRADSPGTSVLGARGDAGCESREPRPITGITVRNSDFDGGTTASRQSGGHYMGLELKCAEAVLIEGNAFRGGDALISLPDSNDVLVRGNDFDMRGSPFWGVEVAKAHDVTVEGNTFFGDGSGGGDHAVSQNSDPRNTVVRDNQVTDIRTVLDTWGSYITVTDNQCSGVLRLLEYEKAPPYVERVIAGNTGCGVTPPATGSGGLR